MITIKAELRNEQGSSAAGRLRRAGFIPGAIKRQNGDIALFQTSAHDYMMATRKQDTSVGVTMTIELDGTPVTAILRETQVDVMTGKPSHLDLDETK